MARGQPPMRASRCNEALCCALRSALCLGQPPARGVDVQCDGALLQRLVVESLRGVQSCPSLANCILPHRILGWDECCAAATTEIQQSLAIWPAKARKSSAPQTARTQVLHKPRRGCTLVRRIQVRPVNCRTRASTPAPIAGASTPSSLGQALDARWHGAPS